MSYIYLALGFMGIIASLIVVSALNPIHRIGYLILVFMIGAFIFMLLDFYFLGLVYIIVYVGALAILFLFIIMMVECNTPTELKNRQNNLDNSLSINLTLPISNCGSETVTVSSTPYNGIIPINRSLVKLNSQSLLVENTNLVNFSIFNCIFFKNFNLTPSHNTFYVKFYNENINKRSTSIIDLSMYCLTLLILLGVIDIKILTNLKDLPDLNQTPMDPDFYLIPMSVIWSNVMELFKNLINMSEVVNLLWCNLLSYLEYFQLQLLDTYFYPVWAIEYLSMTDLETLGIMTYVAYPCALILIALTLWTVMIGIISICSPSKE